MTGFTVTDEAVEAAAGAIWGSYNTGITWPPNVTEYDDADVVRSYARAALEAAARTAQPASVTRIPDTEESTVRTALDNLIAQGYVIVPPGEPQLTATREKLTEALARAIHKNDSIPKEWDELDPIELVAYRDEAGLYVGWLLDDGVFKTEAEVQAKALEDARLALVVANTEPTDFLWRRAAAIRAGGQHG